MAILSHITLLLVAYYAICFATAGAWTAGFCARPLVRHAWQIQSFRDGNGGERRRQPRRCQPPGWVRSARLRLSPACALWPLSRLAAGRPEAPASSRDRGAKNDDDGDDDWEASGGDPTTAPLSPDLDGDGVEGELDSLRDSRMGPMGLVRRGWSHARPNFGIASELSFLGLSAGVGVLTGAAVTVFKTLINLLKSYLYGDFIGNFPAWSIQAVVALVPLIGGLGVVLVRQWAKDFGPGLSGLIEEVDKQAPFNLSRTVAKASAAIMTLGTGNSLGPEGPAVELGVGSSRFVAQWANLSVEKQRMLLGAGAAAGVAAGFNAPIAGVFFALEIVRDSFGSSQFISKSGIAATLLCAAVSALVARTGLHEEYALKPAPYHLESPLVELPFYLGLGFLSGLVAATFRYLMAKSGEAFSGNLPGFAWMADLPWWSKPLMGAAVTGIVGIFWPQVLFFGYDTLDNLLANTGRYEPGTLVALCFWKALTTAICLGSGLVGGTFAPSLFLGATAGAAYQKLLVRVVSAARGALAPSLVHLSTQLHPLLMAAGFTGAGDLTGLFRVAEAPAYAMVGAASVLASVYRAPLTGSLLLFELTEEYEIILPLMASAGVGSLLVELFSSGRKQQAAATAVADGLLAKEMLLEMGNPVQQKAELLLASMPVRDALVSRVLAVSERTPVGVAVEALRSACSEFTIVVECPDIDEGVAAFLAEELAHRRDVRLLGVASLRDIITHADQRDGSMAAAAAGQTVGDCYRRECFVVAPTTNLGEARALLNARGVRYLPVVVDVSAAGEDSSLPAWAAKGVGDESWETDASSFEGTVWGASAPSAGATAATAATAAPAAAAGPAEPKQTMCVGLVSLESLRITLRLRETEQAMAAKAADAIGAAVGRAGTLPDFSAEAEAVSGASRR